MEKICNIVGGGDFSETEIKLDDEDILIAADFGLSYIEKLNLVPDFIVGDFDSLSYKPKTDNLLILPREKDITDTAAAINEGFSRGFRRFRIFGGTGGREDHTIANIQNLVKLTKAGAHGEIIGNKYIITAITNEKIEFDDKKRGFISVFSHSDKSEGVTEIGLKYAISNATLTNLEPLGVSNEFLGRRASVEVKNGTLLIIYDR